MIIRELKRAEASLMPRKHLLWALSNINILLRASKLLKLIKIISFIKVIRITKIITATRRMSMHKSRFAQKQIQEIKRSIYLKNRRKVVLNPEVVAESVKLSLKYDTDLIKKRRKTEAFKKCTTIMIKRKIDNMTHKSIFKKFDNVLVKGRGRSASLILKNKDIEKESFDLSIEKMNKLEEKELNEKIEKNRRLIDDNLWNNLSLLSEPKINKRRLFNRQDSLTIKVINTPQDKNLTVEDSNSKSRILDYSNIRAINMEDDHLLNFHTKMLILNENKQATIRKSTVFPLKSNNFQSDENEPEIAQTPHHESSHHINSQASISEDSENENTKTDVKSNILLKHGRHFNLQKNLSEKIIRKVVIIVLMIIVILPIIDLQSVLNYVYSESELLSKNRYCYDQITKFISAAKTDSVYLYGLNMTLKHCFTNESKEDDTFIALLNFTSHSDYMTLRSKNHEINLPSELKIDNLQQYLEFKRPSSFYINVSDLEDLNNVIVMIYDNSILAKTTYLLNIVRTVVVAFVLILSAIFFNRDVITYVIIPLDKIFSRLDYYLNDFDQYMIDEQDLELLRLNGPDTIKDNRALKTNKLETQLIEMTLKKLVSLISISIGKQGKK